MSDAVYKDYNFILSSRGIIARKVEDTAAQGDWLNLDNCEELAENAISPRLASTAVQIDPGWVALGGLPNDNITTTAQADAGSSAASAASTTSARASGVSRLTRFCRARSSARFGSPVR